MKELEFSYFGHNLSPPLHFRLFVNSNQLALLAAECFCSFFRVQFKVFVSLMNCQLHIGTKHSAISVSDILPSSFHVYFISHSTQSLAMPLSNLYYSHRLHAYQMVSVSLFQCFSWMFHTLYVAVSFACCFLSIVFNFILTEIARKRTKRVGIYR